MNIPGNSAINAVWGLTVGAITNDTIIYNLDQNLQAGDERHTRPVTYSKYSRNIEDYGIGRVLTFEETMLAPIRSELNGYTKNVG